MKNQAVNPQSGNVLFLILIAVALFAALSFAISQSSRDNGQGVTREKERINSAYLIQFPTLIRQSFIRMMLSKSLTPEDISFAHPDTNDYGTFGTLPDNEIFHPQGGDTPYQKPPANVNDGSEWIFNGDLEIANLGTTTGSSASADLMALLPGISTEMCTEINKKIDGVLSTPPTITVAGETDKFTGTFGYTGTITNAALDGKEAYCYYSANLSKYVYYQVIYPR